MEDREVAKPTQESLAPASTTETVLLLPVGQIQFHARRRFARRLDRFGRAQARMVFGRR